MSKLNSIERKTIELDELEKIYKVDTYKEFYRIIEDLILENKIEPIASSGGNGKTPALYKKYRIIKKLVDNKEILEEILYKLSTEFSIEYYRNNLEKYKEHRESILKLNDFFLNKKELLKVAISMNERSFQIWGREKFLQKEGGKTIIKNLGVEINKLNYYDTSEPLAYYSKSREVPQKILILENKDTYYTMRRHLIAGGEKILGENISTLIYGGGKNVKKAFTDFKISVESYVWDSSNTILYFGDLDYEGIGIYEGLYSFFSNEFIVKPFINGYEKMIDKVKFDNSDLPKTKDGQNRNISNIFLNEFSNEYRLEIEKILNGDLYIPQEIINITDL